MVGRLIVFEGIDGSGKQVQGDALASWLKGEGRTVRRLSYPDLKSKYGEILKAFLSGKLELDVRTQFMTFATDILKDQEQITEWLKKGDFVILDRYIPSTVAYQTAHGFQFDRAMKIVESFGFLEPDAIILLKISSKTAAQRRARGTDRHDANVEYLEKVAVEYDTLARRNWLGKWHVVNGERDAKEVTEQIKALISKLL